MGSYMIFDMDFKTKKDRLGFEKYLTKKHIQQKKLTRYHEDGEWCMEIVVYYVGYLGYAEPEIILKDCLKDKIGITFMASLCLSDRTSEWEKIRGRW